MGFSLKSMIQKDLSIKRNVPKYTEYSIISVLTGGDQESEAPSSVLETLIDVGALGKPGTIVL